MQLEAVLSRLNRPKILLRAAKIGLGTYSRNKDLQRLLKRTYTPKPPQAFRLLIAHETTLEKARITGNAAYDMKRHIQVMTALLQEANLLPKTGRKP